LPGVIPMMLPSLRDRKEDIPLLLEHFVRKFSMANNMPPPAITEETMQVCLEYGWPGNVRELQNAVENAIVLGEGTTILPEHLPFGLLSRRLKGSRPDFLNNSGPTFKDKIEAAERIILSQAIDQSDGNKSVAAKKLDISLRTMRYKIKKYDL